MKIENIQVLRGPNIWSISRKKLIQMRLDLQEMEHLPTNKLVSKIAGACPKKSRWSC